MTGRARLLSLSALAIALVLPPGASAATDDRSSQAPWWSDAVAQALARAGDNRHEIRKALDTIPEPQRVGLEFLVVNMPDRDLTSLGADYLLENVRLAYQVREEVPWGKSIPEEIFLNDVLPYANVNERRDAWRKEFHDRFLPLVKECRTPSRGAQVLNKRIFSLLGVKYSRKRKKPDQSPFESIESGLASCTGLSILLADACRAVGIPARLAGTPLWANRSGNHTWVEIWDQRWHFAGAAEPDSRGLDHAWFSGRAAQAIKESRLHAIYAVSFKKTDLPFPMVWARRLTYVSAVNVTERYTAKTEEGKAPSKAAGGKTSARSAPLVEPETKALEDALDRYFGASPEARASWEFPSELERLLLKNERAVRDVAWESYRAARLHEDLKTDFEHNQVRSGKYASSYTVKRVGKKPPGGWPLFIAMHGGGGVPKEVNDRQWRVMQNYYRDQTEVPGYLYLALRAPTDAWNGFYTDYVYPLITNLIRQFLILGDVNSNRVFIMGYSHGGYGAFTIGPKMPDRFAAIHSSAAAPTDGESSPKTLRNTVFTYMIGEQDHAYGRLKRCRSFDAAIRKLRRDRTDIYPVTMEYKQGFGHRGLPDRDKIGDMYAAVRNPVPRHLTWEMTDRVVKTFYWLAVPYPGKQQEIDALCDDNEIRILARGVGLFRLMLDGRLIDFDRPVTIRVNEKSLTRKLRPSLKTLCETLTERGDHRLASTVSLEVTALLD